VDAARQLRAVLAAVERGDLDEAERSNRLVPMIEGAVAAFEEIATRNLGAYSHRCDSP
jgi:hypothetical protein